MGTLVLVASVHYSFPGLQTRSYKSKVLCNLNLPQTIVDHARASFIGTWFLPSPLQMAPFRDVVISVNLTLTNMKVTETDFHAGKKTLLYFYKKSGEMSLVIAVNKSVI